MPNNKLSGFHINAPLVRVGLILHENALRIESDKFGCRLI